MKLFEFRKDAIIQSDDDSYVVHVNLDCVTSLEEIRYNGNPARDRWTIYMGSQSRNITKAGFERIKQAIDSQ